MIARPYGLLEFRQVTRFIGQNDIATLNPFIAKGIVVKNLIASTHCLRESYGLGLEVSDVETTYPWY